MKEVKAVFSKVGLACFVALGSASAIQIILNTIVSALKPEILESTLGIYLITFVPMYLIGFPLGIWIIKKLPETKLEEKKISVGNMIAALCIGYFFMMVGNLIGTGILSALQSAFGTNATPALAGLAMNQPIWIKTLVLCICAPLIEEYFFRKLIIDRLNVYGAKLAVVTSALLFGLFHANLSQFFYTFLLGLLLAIVYIRSGRMRYSAILHICVNLWGTVISVALLENANVEEVVTALEAGNANAIAQNTGFMIYMVAIMIFYCLIIAGLVLTIVKRKAAHFEVRENDLPKDQVLGTVWVNVGMILFVILSLVFTIVALLQGVISL